MWGEPKSGGKHISLQHRLCAMSTAGGRKLEGRVAIVTASTDG